jgi:fermentation-respiration switch protein FrsA (DUF1100 family)
MSLTGDALNSFVESQIFFPDRHLVCTPADYGLSFEDVWFTASDQVKLHGWFVPAGPSDAVLLFCHGNAGNISHRVDNISRLHALGISVFIFDYRGYGNSEGSISEAGFYLDAEAAHGIASGYASQRQQKLVIFGRSLGGIAAVHIASLRPCEGVILESTFTHLGAMAREHFPAPGVHKMLKTRLNSVDKIGQVKVGTLFFHGDLDDIVPISLGRELFDAANAPKEFVIISGAGHNDTYVVGGDRYFEKIKSFVRGCSEKAMFE